MHNKFFLLLLAVFMLTFTAIVSASTSQQVREDTYEMTLLKAAQPCTNKTLRSSGRGDGARIICSSSSGSAQYHERASSEVDALTIAVNVSINTANNRRKNLLCMILHSFFY